MDIILYLLQLIQQLYHQNCFLIHFICKYIPLKQWAFDDSHSPKYQKFKIDELPRIDNFKQDWDWNSNVMSLCLTLHVNLGLSLRKTRQALKDLYNIPISHQQIANYCKTAAVCIKPFVDNYNYKPGNVQTADETYIKIRGVKAYIWFIMDAASRSVLGYQVSDNRGVGPCILAMRMALKHFKELPEKFKFIADGYSAYPLAAQQFFLVLSRVATAYLQFSRFI